MARKKKYGGKLREIREGRLWPRKELAKKSGVSIRTIHNYENGMPARPHTRRLILKALEIPFDRHVELFGPLP